MKYNNVKTYYNGDIYDSNGEARYSRHLDEQVKRGELVKVERQVLFVLYKNGVEDCKHYVDFLVTLPGGRKEVFEYKGAETDRWKYKLDLFVKNYPEIPYRIVRENRKGRYTFQTPDEVLNGSTAREVGLPPRKHYAWFEILLSAIIHHFFKAIMK